MGGKHKQANRTKNNARPSSSSRSAELMGNSTPTFFGFSTIKDGGNTSIVPGFSTLFEETDINIDPNFQLVLKKMNKKDSNTKLKALQEFTDLCKTSEADAVKTVLPLWPRLYCLVCTDVEHRVREAAHNAHRAVISKVKRSIAPYLKQLAGPWFTSQYDTYPPAASAATSAFQEAFSPAKLTEAIVFCQEEILSYIFDNLINQTQQTLSNPKTTSAEEMEAKYQRVVIASLQGYSLYLQRVAPDQIKQAETSNKNLISSPKFWKFAKNKVPLIRNSFFNAIISLCQNASFLISNESAWVATAIFNNLDENDPMVLPTVWDAALNGLVTIEDCWSHVNLEKQVFPKLYVILKEGGRGNSATIFPNILPLLSKLPCDFIKDKSVFYKNLFDHMMLGLKLTSVNQSLSEGKVVATTFLECLKYTVMQHRADVEFCQNLVANHLVPAVNCQLLVTESGSQSVTVPLLSQTSSLLRYWHRHRSTDNLNYQPILTHFWTTLLRIFEVVLREETAQASLDKVLKNQVEFLKILKNPNEYVPKVKGRVKFVEEKKQDSVEKPVELSKPDDSGFEEELLAFVKKLSSVYLQNASEQHLPVYLPYLNATICLFNARDIFEELAIDKNIFSLYTLMFSKWLQNEMRCSAVVETSFKLLSFVREDEKMIILDTFSDLWSDDSLRLDICLALVQNDDEEVIKCWVRSPEFSKNLVELAQQLVESDNVGFSGKEIIHLFFKGSRSADLLISVETASAVLDIISENIEKSRTNKNVNSLAQDIAKCSFNSQYCNLSYQKFVASLFQLSCWLPEDSGLNEAYERGLGTVVKFVEKSQIRLIPLFVKALREMIFEQNFNFPFAHVINKVTSFIDRLHNVRLEDGCATNGDIEEVLDIIKPLIADPPQTIAWRNSIEKCVRRAYEIKGTLSLKSSNPKEKNHNFPVVTSSNYQDALKEMCEILSANLNDEYEESASLKLMNFSEEVLRKILNYHECYEHCKQFVDVEEIDTKISDEMLTKFLKWNEWVVGLVNVFLTAHPRCYKTEAVAWNVYYTNEEELAKFTSENPSSDVIPIKITSEEREEFEQELKVNADVFHESDYNDQNNITPICNEIFNAIYSVGYLNCFVEFFANTSHYHKMKEPVKKAKTQLREALRQATPLEYFFCLYSCKHFVASDARWEIVLPSLRDLFSRHFAKAGIELDIGGGWREVLTHNLTNINFCNVEEVLEASCFIEKFPHFLTEENWDKVFIHLDKNLKALLAKETLEDSDMRMLAALARTYSKSCERFRENQNGELPERISPETCLAWNELVERDLWHLFFRHWLSLADKYHKGAVTLNVGVVLEAVSSIVVDGLATRKPTELGNCLELMVKMARFILSQNVLLQITAYRVMISLVPELIRVDTEAFQANIFEHEDPNSLFSKTSDCDWTCKRLEATLLETQSIVDTLLSDFIIGDCCSVEPFTDSYCYTYSFLLLWCVVVEMCGEAHSALRYQYARWLLDKGYASCILESVFKLMPQAVLHSCELAESHQRSFEGHAPMALPAPVGPERIQQTACFVYRMLLQRLPTVVREWWGQVEHKTGGLVDRVTTIYVSPILIAVEMKSVLQDKETGFDNMEIKSHATAREVVATYTIEEVKMDLVITLPPNHPLGTIKITSSNVVVSTTNWRNWLFHISKYLIHQNGTIWDALVIWKNNLDKKFEGVEECYICFSILQGATFEVPKLCCHTCKKKFHSNCLYKWFSTSNKSTCPICRNLF